MKKDYYVITGISDAQKEAWKDELREDIIMVERCDTIFPCIKLTRWAAFVMRVQMLYYNVIHRYRFGLAKI